MRSTIDILAQAFYETQPRLAVFDVEARIAAGVWELNHAAIPIREILSTFAESPRLWKDDFQLLPLHQPDSAELTGSYIICKKNASDPRIIFFDFSSNSPVSVPLCEFESLAPALQLRYWHPEFTPPETPSYLVEHYSYSPETASQPAPATDSLDDSFFEEIKMFIARERDAERESTRSEYESYNSQQYVIDFDGIPTLEPAGRRIGEDGSQICMLEIPASEKFENLPSTFGIYPESEVLVDTKDEEEGFPVEAELINISGRKLDIRVRWSTSSNHSRAEAAFESDSGTKFRLIHLLNPIPYNRQREGVDAIASDDRKRAIVLGNHDPAFTEIANLGAASRSLNQYQRRAIRRAIGTEDFFCIHGPPGTGKTRTLTNLIREAVNRGQKVLACAHSNQAIDNLLVGNSTLDQPDSHSLHQDALNDDFVLGRIGNNSDHEVVKEYYTGVDSWEANVVGATTNASHQFRTDEFDLVLVDEAGQCSIPSTLLPFSKGTRLILAGDHQQLPPFTSGESAEEEQMEISFFEHMLDLYGDSTTALLQKQYRMNEQIAAFPSQEFYEGKLTHGQRNIDWQIRDLEPLRGIDISGEESRTPGGSYYNEPEAAVVAEEVERLYQSAVPASQIGVITPYNGQIGKIYSALDPDYRDRITISTVDGFQGSERDAIIVSFVRSNSTGNTGFLTFPKEGPRRLNVAITRAKKRLVLIGDWDTLRTTPSYRSSDTDSSDTFERLYSHLESANVLSTMTGALSD